MYNQGYGYAPLGTYPPPNSSIPSMGYDTQLYGAQHYQYPSSFYPSSTSAGLFYPSNHSTHSQGHIASSGTNDKVPFSAGTSTRNPNNRVNAGSVNRINGPASGAGFSSQLVRVHQHSPYRVLQSLMFLTFSCRSNYCVSFQFHLFDHLFIFGVPYIVIEASLFWYKFFKHPGEVKCLCDVKFSVFSVYLVVLSCLGFFKSLFHSSCCALL